MKELCSSFASIAINLLLSILFFQVNFISNANIPKNCSGEYNTVDAITSPSLRENPGYATGRGHPGTIKGTKL